MRGEPTSSAAIGLTVTPQDEAAGMRETTFVKRSTYRMRRMRDLSRLLPFFGFALLLIPLNLPVKGGVIWHLGFVFGVWVLLVLAALFCANELRPERKQMGGDPDQ